MTCNGCGYTSTAYDPFLDISLDLHSFPKAFNCLPAARVRDAFSLSLPLPLPVSLSWAPRQHALTAVDPCSIAVWLIPTLLSPWGSRLGSAASEHLSCRRSPLHFPLGASVRSSSPVTSRPPLCCLGHKRIRTSKALLGSSSPSCLLSARCRPPSSRPSLSVSLSGTSFLLLGAHLLGAACTAPSASPDPTPPLLASPLSLYQPPIAPQSPRLSQADVPESPSIYVASPSQRDAMASLSSLSFVSPRAQARWQATCQEALATVVWILGWRALQRRLAPMRYPALQSPQRSARGVRKGIALAPAPPFPCCVECCHLGRPQTRRHFCQAPCLLEPLSQQCKETRASVSYTCTCL